MLNGPDETQQKGKIESLVLGNIVDRHGTSFQKNGTQQVGDRNGSAAPANPDILDPRASKPLRPARNLDRIKLADCETRTLPVEAIRSEDIDRDAISDKSMGQSERADFTELKAVLD